MLRTHKKVTVGIVGCGAIGEGVALYIDASLADRVSLTAICDADSEKAHALQKKLKHVPEVLDAVALCKQVDMIIETASIDAARSLLEHALSFKKNIIIASVGSLIESEQIIKRAAERGITIYAPSGAVCGVDGLGALSMGTIKEITLTTSKPPQGLRGVAYLKKRRKNLEGLSEPMTVFEGTVKEAIKHFPQNINVAATLYLASSFKNVVVRIVADPHLKRNTHRVLVTAEQASISTEIQSIPSAKNPKTSSLAILSIQYLLKKMFSPLQIGS